MAKKKSPYIESYISEPVLTTELPSLKVLIADDHFLIRQFIRRALTDAGMMNVDMAHDGDEAMDFINRADDTNNVYDVLFLDWNMPVQSGSDVLSNVRSKKSYNNSAVIMFTAEAEKQNIMQAIKMGATSYIQKPISPSDLARKLREIVEWIDSRRTLKA
jgi:two-component system, chemotaxis family, chemotaxis protein CheY